MELQVLVAVGLLGVTALAHTVLGELEVLRPLFADPSWRIPGGSRAGWQRLLRFAWHLTTIAWAGLVAAAVGVDPLVVLAVVATVSGVVVLSRLPGHLAWPLFLTSGLLAGRAAGVVPDAVLAVMAGLAVVVAVAAAGVHVAWAVGRWPEGMAHAIPTDDDGRPAFVPPAWLTLAVAGALVLLAGLVVGVLTDALTGVFRLLAWAAVAVLAARAVGDGRQVGFTKTDRSTPFAVADDLVHTPLVVVLALGVAAALLV